MPTLIKAKTLKNVSELVESGLVRPQDAAMLEGVSAKYSIAISPNMLGIIHEPAIARQFMPSAQELQVTDNELADPIGDDTHSPLKGLVHRYKNRVLIKLLEVCGIYCRFCFRRENVGDNKGQALRGDELAAIYQYLGNHNEIGEVILTGGDPLILSARRLREVAQNIAQIPHIKFFRIHTRALIANPEVFNDDLFAALKASRKAVKMVVHINHAAELNPAVKAAIKKLTAAQIPLYSQSVLLKGVNDNPQVLADLLNALLENNITPYYLHHPDLARGTGHFYVNIDQGKQIYRAAARLVSGLALPKYVIDIPGGFGKIPVNSEQVLKSDNGYILIDNDNKRHNYPIL